MGTSERQAREFMCEIGKKLVDVGMVAANDGNITVQLGPDEFLATPASVSKAFMTPEMICKVDLAGNVIAAEPGVKPTSELPMHLRVYKAAPDVGAVLHAHPVYATVFAIKGEALNGRMLPESVIHMPEVPLAEYGTPSTDAVADGIVPVVKTHRGCLMESHGALTWGLDLMAAYLNMERLEYMAKITYLSRQINGERDLPDAEVERLVAMRGQYGSSFAEDGKES